MSKLLVVDIGNTVTKAGLWDGSRLAEVTCEHTSELRDVSDVDALAASLLESAAGEGEMFPVALCAVAPQGQALWLRWAEAVGAETMVLTGETETPLRTRYRQPEHLGPDRLAAAVGAAARMGTPVVVVSLGTATVVDLVSADGKYLGGVIAVGVDTGLEALSERTAALPRVASDGDVPLVGATTEECMRSGAVLGAAAMIEGLLARFEGALGEAPEVALTGGHAEAVSPQLRIRHKVFPHLVLEGAAAIWEHNQR